MITEQKSINKTDITEIGLLLFNFKYECYEFSREI